VGVSVLAAKADAPKAHTIKGHAEGRPVAAAAAFGWGGAPPPQAPTLEEGKCRHQALRYPHHVHPYPGAAANPAGNPKGSGRLEG
jgi:hypothetical protein